METSTSQKIKKITRRARQKGISTVQVAIGIMVSVIVLLGAIGGYQYVNQGKVGNEIAAISDLKVATVKYGSSVGSFTASNTPVDTLNTWGFWNNSAFTWSSGSVANQWGGSVTVSAPTTSSLSFTFSAVPQSACIDLAGKLDNVADSITVGSTSVKSTGSKSSISGHTGACVASTSISYVLTR